MAKHSSDLAKCKHPNSRKTKSLLKEKKKTEKKNKNKLNQSIKQNVIGEKVLWFQKNLLPDVLSYNSEQSQQLIKKYLGRFNEELEQIKIKHSIGQKANRQHASREDIINLTIKHEQNEYKTCGIEIPDVMNSKQLQILRNWNGELRFLQNFSLKRISLPKLQLKTQFNGIAHSLEIQDNNVSEEMIAN